MEVIDTYREKGFYGLRLVQLYDDRVVVQGKPLFGAMFNVPVPLVTLEPMVGQYGVKERIGLLVLVCLGGGLFDLIGWCQKPDPLSQPGFWAGWIILGLGVFLLFRWMRHIETVGFYTSAGVLRLSLSKIGPDVGRYYDFVERVKSQIALCRAAHMAAPGPVE